MKLCTMFEKLPYLVETRGNMVTEISTLCSNSREKVEGGLFFCIPGARFDAHDYAPRRSRTAAWRWWWITLWMWTSPR